MGSSKKTAASARRRGGIKNAAEGQSSADTATRIVDAATRLFAQKGYDGTSTKDICDAAGANIAAIHYHFGSKEKLYQHIINQFAAERLDFARRILQAPENVDDFKVRLEIFLRQTLETMIKQRDIIALIQRDVEMADERSKEMYLNTLIRHAEKLVEFFDRARQKGILAADVKSFSAAGFLMSTIIHQTKNDRMVKRFSGHSLFDEGYRNEWIQQTLRIFLSGVVAR